MTQYAEVSKATGHITRVFGWIDADGMGPPSEPPQSDEFDYHLVTEPIDWSNRPTETAAMAWNDGAPTWVEAATLDEAKANAWTKAKAARDAAEAQDFEFNGVLYQPDITKITGAVLEAMLPRAASEPPFSIDWTVSDNSVVTLDAVQMVGLGRTLAARLNAIHQKGRTLRALIEAATTPEQAYQYTWESLNAE